MIQELGRRTGRSERRLAQELGLSRASLQRWKRRLRRCETPVRPRGRRKSGELAGLDEAIGKLGHRRHRSRGAPELWQAWRERISRRDFQERVRAVRDERKREARAGWERIEWTQAGAVWAMDPAEHAGVRWNLVGDLASRYRFELLVGPALPAAAIAGQLAELFERYGAPLVLKRDHGSNLMSAEVDEALHAFGVLALPSPVHYPRYNGGIEYGQREIKEAARGWRSLGAGWKDALAMATAEINARHRPCLRGETAARVFHAGLSSFLQSRPHLHRKELRDWIKTEQESILAALRTYTLRTKESAWRQAIERWLVEHGVMNIINPQRVSPISS